MKKIFTIAIAAVAALVSVSCVKEQLAIFDDSKATAPVINSYELGEKALTVDYTPGSFNQSFNENMTVNHVLVLTNAGGTSTNKVLMLTRDGQTHESELKDKHAIAKDILDVACSIIK